jgi:hypothetical protein
VSPRDDADDVALGAWSAAVRRPGAAEVLARWPSVGARPAWLLTDGDPFAGVHESWFASHASPEARVWLARATRLVDMRTDDDELNRVLARAPDELVSAIERAGRERLALATHAAPDGAARALAARLGDAEGASFLAEFKARAGASRELVREAVRELAQGVAEPILLHAGARHLAPLLLARGDGAVQRLAQRLPVDAGRVLLDEAAGATPRAGRLTPLL